jgi:hypothetical protein
LLGAVTSRQGSLLSMLLILLSYASKEFGVIVNSGARTSGPWAADVVADGTRTSNPVFLADQSCNVGYYQKSSTVKRPFAFSKLELVGMSLNPQDRLGWLMFCHLR